jgi:hypothetical protein
MGWTLSLFLKVIDWQVGIGYQRKLQAVGHPVEVGICIHGDVMDTLRTHSSYTMEQHFCTAIGILGEYLCKTIRT